MGYACVFHLTMRDVELSKANITGVWRSFGTTTYSSPTLNQAHMMYSSAVVVLFVESGSSSVLQKSPCWMVMVDE